MALPPDKPLKYNNRDVTYFEMLAIKANDYLAQYGIKLNFNGYTETVNEYKNMEFHEGDIAWRLSKELNAWAEYFSEISNLIQKILLDSESDEREKQAISSIKFDSEKVSNGNRLSYKDKAVVESIKKKNTLKAFHDELDAKVRFLERAHYHCKITFESNEKARFPVFKNN